MDDTSITKIIDSSPLKNDDKDHWKSLLPKLTDDQKSQLTHSIKAKTEVVKVIRLIDEALGIIEKAESEAESEPAAQPTTITSPKPTPKAMPDKYKDVPSLKDTETLDKSNQDALKKEREETHERLEKIRKELKNLSVSTHGTPPPSYGAN